MKITKKSSQLCAAKSNDKTLSRGEDPRDQEAKQKNRKIAEKIRLFMKDNNISRPQLEGKVGRSKSTMDHFFAGEITPGLLALVEHVLGQQFGESSGISPPEWGGYTQESTKQIAGSYLTLRNDYKNSELICAYVTAIEWSKVENANIYDGRLIREPRVEGYGLVFREERRVDKKYAHRGQVWYPLGQFVYLVTAYGDGRLRAAIVSVPDHEGRMVGLQLSLHNPKGPALAPAAAPIALVRRERVSDKELGTFRPGGPYYDTYREILAVAYNDVVIPQPFSG